MAASITNTTVAPSFITDAVGGEWCIVSSPTASQVCHNGVIDPSTANVALLLYNGDVVYYQNVSKSFFSFLNPGWAASSDPRLVAPSPSGTTVTTAGPAITDASLEKWTLVASATAATGNQIAVNGVVDTVTNNVILLLYDNSLVYQQNSGLGWWSKPSSSATWTATTDPRTTAVLSESASGTTVTAVGPAIIDATLEKWTLVLSATASVGNQIAVNGVVDTVTGGVTLLLYFNHLVFQQTSGGWWSKPISTAAWTATADPRVTTTPTTTSPTSSTVPALAKAAGFTQLVYADDFTTTSTVATSYGATTGFNWYWGSSGTTPTVNPTSINTTQQAASLSNGNSGGGTNASPNGGIMAVTGNAATNGNYTGNALMTCNASQAYEGGAQKNGTGNFLYGYFEWYMQFNTTKPYTSGEYSVWSAPVTSGNTGNHTEIDFLETGFGGFGSTPEWGSALHNWAANGGADLNSTNIPAVHADSNWHTYSALWTPTNITIYLDGVAIPGGSTALGSGSAFPATNLFPIFIILAPPIGFTQYFDWFRVWQAPGSAVVNTPAQFNPPLS